MVESTAAGRARGPSALADTIVEFWRSIEELRHRCGTELGISATELEALTLITQSEGMSPGDIATALGVTTGSVTPIVDHLTQAGYVQRSPHPGDRRRVQLTAKPGGSHAVAWAREQLESALQAVAEQTGERDASAAAQFLSATTERLARP